MYKSHLEKRPAGSTHVDSARQNLAATFVKLSAEADAEEGEEDEEEEEEEEQVPLSSDEYWRARKANAVSRSARP